MQGFSSLRLLALSLLALLLASCCVQPSSAQLTPIQLLYLFSPTDIALSLALSANATVAYVSTFNGRVYAIPLPVASNAVLPTPIYAPSGTNTPVFQGISVSPAQDRLVLLDTRGAALVQLSLSTRALSTICTFTSETVNSLASMAVDWTPATAVAYVGSQTLNVIYGVATTPLGQTQSSFAAIYTDAQGLAFTGLAVVNTANAPTLYISSPTVAQGTSNIVFSYLRVQGTTVLSTTAVTALYSSATWYWPDAITVNPSQTTAWITDGGYDKGYIPSEPPFEYGNIYQINITSGMVAPSATGSAAFALLYSNNTAYLRGGIQLTPDLSTLVYVASTTLNALVVYPGLQTRSLVGPPIVYSSSGGAAAASTGGAASGGGGGTTGLSPIQLLFLFAPTDIALSLVMNAAQTVAYISTFSGNVYAIPVPVSSNARLPTPIYHSTTSAVFQGISVSPTADRLILLDTRLATINLYTIATGTYQTICTFTSETTNSLTSLAVDWTLTTPVAYVASQTNAVIYGVAITPLAQTQSSFAAIYTDAAGLIFTGLTLYKLTGSNSNLFITSATTAQGTSNVVFSYLPVSGTTTLTATAVIPLYSSATWYWPDAVVVNNAQTTAWIMDGGYDKGYIPSEPPFEYGNIYQINLSGAVIANPPAGGAATSTTLYSNQHGLPARRHPTHHRPVHARLRGVYHAQRAGGVPGPADALAGGTPYGVLEQLGRGPRVLLLRCRCRLLRHCGAHRHAAPAADLPLRLHRYRPVAVAEHGADGGLRVHLQRQRLRHPRARRVQRAPADAAVPLHHVGGVPGRVGVAHGGPPHPAGHEAGHHQPVHHRHRHVPDHLHLHVGDHQLADVAGGGLDADHARGVRGLADQRRHLRGGHHASGADAVVVRRHLHRRGRPHLHRPDAVQADGQQQQPVHHLGHHGAGH